MTLREWLAYGRIDDAPLQPMGILTDPQYGQGIVILIASNLSNLWQSGQPVIWWPNGDHTDVDGLLDSATVEPIPWGRKG